MATQVKLNGKQLIEDVIVSWTTENGPKHTKAKIVDGVETVPSKAYRVLIYNGIAFTVAESVYQAWQSGKLASMTLMQDTRKATVTDEEGNESQKDVDTYAYAGSASREQVLNNAIFDTKMKALDQMVASDTGLDMAKIQALETAGI